MRWDGRHLFVERLPTARNPIFFHGVSVDRMELEIGEHFVIGQTDFRLVNDRAQISLEVPAPVRAQAYSADFLRQTGFHHAQQQVHALTRLPEIVAGANSDHELYARLVNLILTGMLTASSAAVVLCPLEASASPAMEVLHWDSVVPNADDFQPSALLIRDAIRSGESVVHFWHDAPEVSSVDGDFTWAFCVPIPGVASRGQGIYVTGKAAQIAESFDLQDALKFVELMGTTVGHVRDLQRLQERAAAFAQFFSPPVRDVISVADPDKVLAPRKTEVTVLFCDLRGFSRQSEQSADDLFGLLQRVSEALGIMTRQILDLGGVVGDFHGDAAMGFWGWPLTDRHQVAHACQAALAIQAGFEDVAQREQHALSGFRVGMGLATGEAVAGKLGTVDQVKVTVFGPVVNLAARLEGLTRPMGVAILADAKTAQVAAAHLPTSVARLRHVARVQPYGMTSIEEVYELLPSPAAQLDAATATPPHLAPLSSPSVKGIGTPPGRISPSSQATIPSGTFIFSGCNAQGVRPRTTGTASYALRTSPADGVVEGTVPAHADKVSPTDTRPPKPQRM